ncbi:MAG: TldD/PmbA family protein [Nocardioides sp.]
MSVSTSNSAADRQIDPSFQALPFRELAATALHRLGESGAEHGDFRFERVRELRLQARDQQVQGSTESADTGYAIRVVHRGAWGFAAGFDLSADAVARTVDQAIAVAEIAATMTSEPVAMAPEPTYRGITWISEYDVDPGAVPTAEKSDLLVDWTRRLRSHPVVAHASASLHEVQELTYYADLAGSDILQQRIRMAPEFEAMGVDESAGIVDSMRSLAPPVGRGWEYLVGGYPWDDELDQVPELLAEKLAAPSVEGGTYDLVIDPSNLWLTIHESIGHATELDRALGYEANYAGTSFATPDRLGDLRYGSELMRVTGDRTTPHGLATVGYDHEGVRTREWDLIADGVLVGYQLDRAMAHAHPEISGGRSNGCAFADSPGHMPIQRMANVSLQPVPDGPSTADLIAGVDRGIYVVGDKSWSIDMQRFNFQFTGQRFFAIRNGRLVGQVRDVAYQATTTDFWGAMSAVGGPDTYVLGGSLHCGKAQPAQIAAVSHGCPAAVFDGIRILNTRAEQVR